MAKKKYITTWMELTPDEDDPDIPVAGSQDIDGDISIFSFGEGFTSAELTMIQANCGYFDLLEMDVNGDRLIEHQEFLDWLAVNPW